MILMMSIRVSEVLTAGGPVVALESALLTHGLPHPTNLEVARRLEGEVRENGAQPATVGVLGGRLKVGLSDGEIERLARATNPRKISLRDLPVAGVRGWDGGTTVAVTAWAAHRVGIRVFATGGIGAVHPGQAMDISADLPVLARTPIIVVCAGAKSILDLPRTLEWLETYGVPVIGFGTDEFPAFYTRSSGLPVNGRVDDPREVAAIFRAMRGLELPAALLVAVPVPASAEPPAQLIDGAIRQAQNEAAERHIGGHELTPFLLARIGALTQGASTRANIALLENNARVAAQIAVALAEII